MAFFIFGLLLEDLDPKKPAFYSEFRPGSDGRVPGLQNPYKNIVILRKNLKTPGTNKNPGSHSFSQAGLFRPDHDFLFARSLWFFIFAILFDFVLNCFWALGVTPSVSPGMGRVRPQGGPSIGGA